MPEDLLTLAQVIGESRRIEAAAAEISDRLRQLAEARRREQDRRRPLRAVDRILDELEKEHMKDRVLTGLELAAWQWRLPDLVSRPIPQHVRRAATSTQLHSALLDWQEELHHEASSRRCMVPRATAGQDT